MGNREWGMGNSMERFWRILAFVLSLVFWLPLAAFAWMALGWIVYSFSVWSLPHNSLRSELFLPMWVWAFVGLAPSIVWRKRKVLIFGLGIVFLFALAYGGVYLYEWMTFDRYERISAKSIDWSEYRPFAPSNRLVKAECPSEFRFEGKCPKVFCAYALYPIGAAAFEAQATKESGVETAIREENSPKAYASLMQVPYEDLRPRAYVPEKCDVILALAPSEAQRETAEKAGLEFELTPVSKDAFVFFVSAENPAEGLTSQQIRDIYSGKVTSWKELGVDFGAKLYPYQRNAGSGSQSALERMMGDTPIMPPLREDRRRCMAGIVKMTADYRNQPGAIGFSFRYYVNELMKGGKVKLLKIDGVEPTVENIRSGAYPFVETAYAITVSQREGNVSRFVDFLVSPEGRELVERTGYVAP